MDFGCWTEYVACFGAPLVGDVIFQDVVDCEEETEVYWVQNRMFLIALRMAFHASWPNFRHIFVVSWLRGAGIGGIVQDSRC